MTIGSQKSGGGRWGGPIAVVFTLFVGGGLAGGCGSGASGADAAAGHGEGGASTVGAGGRPAGTGGGGVAGAQGGRSGAGGAATGGAAGGGVGGAGNRGGTGGEGGGAGGGAQGGAGGGAGSGRCTTFQFQPSHPSPDQILVDMDGDGRLDVVSSWTDSTALHVMVYRQTAPRLFADPDEYDSGTYADYDPTRMAAADLDQDGLPDLAMPDDYGNVALMLSGGGSGYSFAPLLRPSVTSDNGAPLDDVALADFDGDGYRDIAVPIWNPGSGLGIHWGTGKGGFSTRANQTLCDYGSRTMVIDANEDGLPDLALGCLQAGGHVLVNQGGRSFAHVVLPGGTQSLGLAVGDLNHDGHVDIVMPDTILKQLIVSLGDGHGNFAVPKGSVAATGPSPWAVTMGDLDGDGNADVLLTDEVQQTTLFFYHGMGDGHFQASQTYPVASYGPNMTIGDVDGDGFQDLVLGNGPTIVYGPCP